MFNQPPCRFAKIGRAFFRNLKKQRYMANKKNLYGIDWVEFCAMQAIKEMFLGGVYPSDAGLDWSWDTICDLQKNPVGIWVQVQGDCYSMSFKAVGFAPVRDDSDNVLGYVKTTKEK